MPPPAGSGSVICRSDSSTGSTVSERTKDFCSPEFTTVTTAGGRTVGLTDSCAGDAVLSSIMAGSSDKLLLQAVKITADRAVIRMPARTLLYTVRLSKRIDLLLDLKIRIPPARRRFLEFHWSLNRSTVQLLPALPATLKPSSCLSKRSR